MPPSHTLPAAHFLHLMQLVERWGVTEQELLDGLDLDASALLDPRAVLEVATVETLIERARRLTGEPALGFYLGLQMQLSSHGYLGFAAMTAATIGDALRLAAVFAPTRTSAIALRLRVEDQTAALVLQEQASFGSARDVLVFALFVGIARIGELLTGQALRGSVDVAFEEPEYFARFRDSSGSAFAGALASPVRFGQPLNQLVFDRELLDLPIKSADPIALQLATQQCEAELRALGRSADLVGQVKQVLADSAGMVSIEDAARALHVSSRTLKRRLAERGLTFTELTEQHRVERALLLLRSQEQSLEQVAAALGYSDAANFSRAFRRWTGQSPGEWRRGGGV